MKWSRFLALILCVLLIVPQSCAFAAIRILNPVNLRLSDKLPEDCTNDELCEVFEPWLGLYLMLDAVIDAQDRISAGETVTAQEVINSMDPEVFDYFTRAEIDSYMPTILNTDEHRIRFLYALALYSWNVFGDEIISRVTGKDTAHQYLNFTEFGLNDLPEKDIDFNTYINLSRLMDSINDARKQIASGENITVQDVMEKVDPKVLEYANQDVLDVLIPAMLKVEDYEIRLIDELANYYVHLSLEETFNNLLAIFEE